MSAKTPAHKSKKGGFSDAALQFVPSVTRGEKKMPDTVIANIENTFRRSYVNARSRAHTEANVSNAKVSWLPASQAYVVMEDWPADKRLIMLTRGQRRSVQVEGVAELSKRETRALAYKLNRQIGVPTAAAKALSIDWNNEFSTPPICPKAMAKYLKGKVALRRAYRGKPSAEPCSSGWLRLSVQLHYWQPLDAFHLLPSEYRFIELAAYYEGRRWAEANGRETRKAMHVTERAALAFLNAGTNLRELSRSYNDTYSRESAQISLRCRDVARYAAIKEADQTQRRKELLALRDKRRTALRALNRARGAYLAARPEVFAPTQKGREQ